MRPLLVRLEEAEYRQLGAIAVAEGRPVAALVRQAVTEYLRRQAERSVVDIPAHSSGQLLRSWDRGDLCDEMRDERRLR